MKQRKNKTCFREEKFDKIEFKEQEMIDRNFPLCENISVDYAIMDLFYAVLSL